MKKKEPVKGHSEGSTEIASRYDHAAVEAKWQQTWTNEKLNLAPIADGKKPYYNLMMFPYPSAEGLHVGNMYAFTGSDIFGRYKRMAGYDVFEPIGLDGFGIHSENFALKIGRHPMDHATITEKNFYIQLGKIGAMFDWSRTVETYHPEYYAWTQWLFVQMFRHGLAYRGMAEVNWCPSCKTVLADEQVIDGKCERCGNNVGKRSLNQWFFRITAYAEKLLGNLASLDWSEKVKVAQKNWIGKKEGINITYDVVTEEGEKVGQSLEVFTTTPVNFAATFLAVAPEHPFVQFAINQREGTTKISEQDTRVIDSEKAVKSGQIIKSYVAKTKKKTPEERAVEGRTKTGVFSGLFALNQVTGEQMPIWISDFVLMGFGTGAIQGCPGHDLRDFEFAQTFGIPIKRVIMGPDGDTSPISKPEQVIEHGDEGTMINSEFLDGMSFDDAMKKTMDYFEQKGWGKRVTTYHLRDWLISRQRYWGPPIPMIYCEHCAKEGKSWFTTEEAKIMNLPSTIHDPGSMVGWYTVPEPELPVVLPRIDDYKPGDDGIAPLAKHAEFYQTSCPGGGKPAVRETDVSDTFLDSSWYFLRYPTVGSESASTKPFDIEITKRWLPVDMYTGGAEHSVLHLMYSRFVTMALKDWGMVDFEEPFSRFFAHGLVVKDGAKMSKSKGNVVNPDEYIALYGADALRLYLMFMGPFSQGGDFRDTAMEGMSRWVGRIWRLANDVAQKKGESPKAVKAALQKTIKRVTEDMEARRYNTAIAAMMEFTNLVADEGGALGQEDLKTLILLLAPFAPHFTEELWHKMNSSTTHDSPRFEGEAGQRLTINKSVHTQPWPTYDESAIVEDMLTVVVQINGKLRDSLILAKDDAMKQDVVEAMAQARENVIKHLAEASVKKVIFVPGKLINFVV